MALTNKISIDVTTEKLNKAKDGLNLISEAFPEQISLSVEERKAMPKMGDKSIAFVRKALEYGQQNPDIVPKYLDINEYKKDLAASEQLFSLIVPLRKLLASLEDTAFAAGSEAYSASLVIYSSLKSAINFGDTSLQGAYEDLAARFPGRPAKTANNNTDTPTN
jgi:hypothetical protein